MKRYLLTLIAFCFICFNASAVSLSTVKLLNKSHSDALIGFNFSSWSGNLRIRVTTGATNCSSGSGGTLTLATYTSGSHAIGVNNYFQYVVTNLPPATPVHVCPEINSYDQATDWTTGNQLDFVTDSLPAVHPAPPVPVTATDPTPPDMTGACVWKVGISDGVDGTDGTTHCTGETPPDCSTFMPCWNAAMDQQMAHKTLIKIAAGSTVSYRNYVLNMASDTVSFNGASFSFNGMSISNNFSEGQGLVFGVNQYTAGLPNGDSGDHTCDGLFMGRLFYVHNPNSSGFQLTCGKPYSQGGKVLKNRSLPGGGTFYYAKYPRELNWIRITTTTPANQLPPVGVRTSPAYAPKMAKFTQDSNSSVITQDGVANVYPFILQFQNYDGGNRNRMAANQWIDNLEIVAPSYCIDNVNGCDGYGVSNAASSMIFISSDNQNIVIDRCWIHGRPWPNRMKSAITFDGTNSALINNYMSDLTYGRKMIDLCTGDLQADITHIADAPNQIRSGVGPGPLIMSGNYIEGTGIHTHFDGAGEWNSASNILVRRNTFTVKREHLRLRGGTCGGGGTNNSGYPEDPLWDGHAHSTRQELEFKGGHQILIDGNIFENNARYASTGSVQLTSVTRQGVYDVDITNNSFPHTYAAVTAVSTGDGQLHTKPFNRLRFSNNVISDLNGDGLNGWVNHVDDFANPYQRMFGGYVFRGLGNGEDYIVDHITVTTNPTPLSIGLGYELAQPGLLNLLDEGSEGLQITNSILNMTNELSGINGISRDGTRPCVAGGCATAASERCNVNNISGSALFSCMFPTAVVKNNLMLATSGSSSTLTNAASGWSDGGGSAFPSANISGNIIPSNPQINPGYTDWRNGAENRVKADLADARLKAAPLGQGGSPYAPGNNGGREIGANIDQLEAHQGKVSNVAANGIGTTTATISFVAPDAQACPVDISSTDPTVITNFIRVTDAGGARTRAVSLTGLSSGTAYYYRVNCAVMQPVGILKTR